MKITKKCIAMLAALLICFILRGDILQCVYYNYHFNVYLQETFGYIGNIFGYISIFLVFACGFFEIYDLKRLGLIFLIIQPAKLIMDISEVFIFDRFGLHIFYPLLGLSLLYILIYFADLFINIVTENKRIKNQSIKAVLHKGIIKRNLKHYLIAFVVSLAGHIAANILIYIINALSIKDMSVITDEVKLINRAITYSIVNLSINICLLVAVILCLKGIFNKIYTPTAKVTKTSEISLTAAAIVLPIVYAVYYLMNYVNPIFYYFGLLDEAKQYFD